MTTEQRGPDVGDEVEITVRGRVTARTQRDGVEGVYVEVPGMLNDVWRPAVDGVVVLDRRRSA